MRGYLRFLGGQENGLNYCLYIAEEHPVLNSFSFQAGFYLINDNKPVEKNVGTYEGGFACSGGETNPGNWQKYVEVDNQITITPYEVENDSELSENSIKRAKSENKCLVCRKRREINDPDNWYLMKGYHGQNLGSVL